MDQKEIKRIFYRDGYRLAHEYLDEELTAANLKLAIVQLYRVVDQLLLSFLQRSAAEGLPADCSPGCSWCCYQEVFAVTHEFLFLNEHAFHEFGEKQREGILERARDKAALTVNRSVEEQLCVRAACPFLEAGNCLVYKARPMACRIYLSSSVLSCRRKHDEAANDTIIPELFEFPLIAGRMLNEGFVAYLKMVGLLSSELPIEQGVASMIRPGQTLNDWIEGSGASS
jgi:Fe-S-cluster containining protein